MFLRAFVGLLKDLGRVGLWSYGSERFRGLWATDRLVHTAHAFSWRS